MLSMFIVFTFLGMSYAFFTNELKVVNGTNAREGEFKFAVSLRENNTHFCGGSIINKRYILTAAHCVCSHDGVPEDVRNVSIQYGSVKISATEERSVPVSRITCNNSLLGYPHDNDMAILKLTHDLPDDGTWEPVKLSKIFNSSEESKGVIIGWGYLSANGPLSDILQKLEMDIYNDTVCQKFGSMRHLCLGAPIGGACYGDSGSPLLSLDNHQIGLTSYGTFKCGIANKRIPNVYVRVDYFYSWIENLSKV